MKVKGREALKQHVKKQLDKIEQEPMYRINMLNVLDTFGEDEDIDAAPYTMDVGGVDYLHIIIYPEKSENLLIISDGFGITLKRMINY